MQVAIILIPVGVTDMVLKSNAHGVYRVMVVVLKSNAHGVYRVMVVVLKSNGHGVTE
jgi:hypothetical protein